MKKIILTLLLACGLSAFAQTPVTTTPTFGDDNYVHVPLQFGFPFYGRTFTNSWMHSNGVVSFLDPAVSIPGAGYNPGAGAYCCEGIRPSVLTPQFSYMIAPLWTDLMPVQQSVFRTEGTTQYQRYYWENIGEISNTSNLNTFGVEIRPSGFIGINYGNINIQNQNVWSGIIGNPTLGEWQELHYNRGIAAGALQSWSTDITSSICASGPLSSPSCPGYTEAMCTSNQLFSPSCPGYASAYQTQQCSINVFYSVNCPGYAAAYLEQQCSINPLYSTTCQGYATAYFNQQCSMNTLYSVNCPGYAAAYRDQQCSLNPLFSNTCSGYAEAYKSQQCSMNGLYATDCPNYAQAYFNQQCSLNGLYNTLCPNYTTAYATKMALDAVATSSVTSTNVAQTVPLTTSSSSPATVAVIADPVVNSVVTSTSTSASPAQAATAIVPLAPVASSTPTTSSSATEEKKSASSNTTASAETKSDAKPTARQELQAKREAAAKAKAVEQGKNMASNMAKAADMEAQKELQNVVLQAMAFTPGFDSYSNVIVPDAVGYKPFTVYDKQVNVDNRRLGMGLYGPSDRLHNELVNSQYKGN